METLHARALLENRAFDALAPWKQSHPRTFWQAISAVADLLEPKPLDFGHQMGYGTGTSSFVKFEGAQIWG